jgi:acetoin utilization deacetylase AcuC-like enzyme
MAIAPRMRPRCTITPDPAMQRSLSVVEDPRFRDHAGPSDHPERPARLAAVSRALAPRRDRLESVPPRPAGDEELLRVHTRDHLALVAESARRAPCRLDPDTYACAESHAVARLAAGASVDLARRVARGESPAGFAAVRPPGHHAEAGRAMGFCLFNNVAIAARALQAEEGLERILILDWDVHHGNGTQHSFEEDASILYASTHQFPYYPGTGDFGEAGRGDGEGATLNVPMPPGCGDSELIGVLQRVLVPAARAFRPELILVSCGFDAHRDDPLASLDVSGSGFADATHIVRALADDLCGGRLVLLLEGGYAESGLEDGTAAVVDALLEVAPAPVPVPEAPPGSTLRGLVQRVAAVHGARIPDIGAP